MTYEELLQSADAEGIDVLEYHFASENIKGLYCDGTIALNRDIRTTSERACILAEELGHYYTSFGDIIDLTHSSNRKQEYHARLWSYNNQVGLNGILSAYKAGCRNAHETAIHLGVTEEFLQEALTCYQQKYGVCTVLDNYAIYFEPTISVLELI